MSHIVVCPLDDVASTVAYHGAKEMITLLSPDQTIERPQSINSDRHLLVGINDISFDQEGLISPEEQHVASIIEFAKGWDQTHPLVIHCWFGISRSPAAALICALVNEPDQNEQQLANRLRTASKSATPNRRIIEIGDKLLNRHGKLSRAVNNIGRGADASQGTRFTLTTKPEA